VSRRCKELIDIARGMCPATIKRKAHAELQSFRSGKDWSSTLIFFGRASESCFKRSLVVKW